MKARVGWKLKHTPLIALPSWNSLMSAIACSREASLRSIGGRMVSLSRIVLWGQGLNRVKLPVPVEGSQVASAILSFLTGIRMPEPMTAGATPAARIEARKERRFILAYRKDYRAES